MFHKNVLIAKKQKDYFLLSVNFPTSVFNLVLVLISILGNTPLLNFSKLDFIVVNISFRLSNISSLGSPLFSILPIKSVIILLQAKSFLRLCSISS
ncbi:MAG TPA: hypothetical protein IAB35_06255 [Candidatus Faecimonas gallistercoris]|nr:hypothetical protein [Candidatus Faecimonas gallistercoris]